MKVSRKERENLHAALVDAFPAHANLARMVQVACDVNINTIVASSDNLEDEIFKLIEHFNAKDDIPRLLEGARMQNPGNKLLDTFARNYYSTDEPARTRTSARSTVSAEQPDDSAADCTPSCEPAPRTPAGAAIGDQRVPLGFGSLDTELLFQFFGIAIGAVLVLASWVFTTDMSSPHRWAIIAGGTLLVVSSGPVVVFMRRRGSSRSRSRVLARRVAAACKPITDDKLQGRESELKDLLGAISADVFERVLVYTGPSGVGKSSLLYAKNGLLARLVEHGWTREDRTMFADFVPLGAVSAPSPGHLALMTFVSGRRRLVVYDQAEQLLTMDRRSVGSVDDQRLRRWLEDPAAQVLFVLREEACATFLNLLKNSFSQVVSTSAVFFLGPLDTRTAMVVTRATLSKHGVDIGKRESLVCLTVEAVSDASSRVLPIELKLYMAVGVANNFYENKDRVLDHERAKEQMFHALVHSHGNPVLAAQILLILAAEPKWRRSVPLTLIKDLLPQYPQDEVEDLVRFYQASNIVLDRGAGRLELACDFLASLIHDKTDLVLLGTATRNTLYLCRRMTDPEHYQAWKLNVVARLVGGSALRRISIGMATAATAMFLLRLTRGPFWGTKGDPYVDFQFVAAFMQCVCGAWFITRYNLALLRFLPRDTGLVGYTRCILLNLIGFGWGVVQCCWPDAWMYAVGSCYMMIGASNATIYGIARQNSPTESHNAVTIVAYGLMIFLVGCAFARLPRAWSEPMGGTIELILSLFVAVAVWRSSFSSFGHVGFASMSTQTFRMACSNAARAAQP